jgi:hypothetical protein
VKLEREPAAGHIEPDGCALKKGTLNPVGAALRPVEKEGFIVEWPPPRVQPEGVGQLDVRLKRERILEAEQACLLLVPNLAHFKYLVIAVKGKPHRSAIGPPFRQKLIRAGIAADRLGLGSRGNAPEKDSE